ncbi:uncharacterized protein LOC107676474 [Sinocyclocheilus anshuiensis]|uniref:uncharacterized protein LOC107676474 n=1 Tax=Sinocyclocheilus anshuiensis TaxID=1608454 RepID=UPI0007B97F4B|nr:PREDICTED: uncharacterized protein LOC107676474 [Sinocyclocheilus anshuiensis]
MAGRVEGTWIDVHRLSILRARRRRCSCTHASGGMRSTKLSSLAIFLLLFHSAQAYDDDLSHEASGSFLDAATSPSSTHLFGGFHMTDRNPASVVQSDPTGSSKGSREQPAFSSVLTLLASTAQKPPKLSSKVVARDNETHQWPSNGSLERLEPFTLPLSVLVSSQSNNSGSQPEACIFNLKHILDAFASFSGYLSWWHLQPHPELQTLILAD